MQKTKRARLLSLLLAAVLVLGLVPMSAMTVFAAYNVGDISGTTGDGTASNPVVCNTFDGFKAAMEHSGITFVKLAGIPGGPVVPNPAGPELQTAITQNGPKTLIIEGDTDLYAPLGGRIDSLIAVTNTLSVMGNGRLTFYGGLSNAKNCVLRAFNTNSHITVGGTGNKPILIGKPNGNTYGRAITASMGKVTINDGKFEAHGNAHAVYALELDGDVKAEILGGEFYAENTSSEKANLGLSIQSETADVTIKGGRFTSGIRVHSSKQISDYLPAGYELRAISGDAPIGGNTTAITGGCYVMSAKEINKAVINVTEPAAGANRQDPTIPADSNTSIHNQGWTKLVDGTPQSFSGVFKAGETYRLEVVLVPDTTNGYSFTTNATATINGVTAKIVSSDTTRIHCYRDFKISGTSIQDVAIIVEEPVVGATPATPVTTTTNTTVDTHTWSQGDDPFQSGQARTLTVVVHPTDGDFFSDTVAPTINGKPATIHMKSKDHINCSYEFTVGAPDPVIGHIDVSFTPPAAGGTIEKEVSSYTAAPNCEVTEVQWSPMDGGDWDTFTGGKKYRCTITIVPNEGFFFSSSVPQTTAKFNGIDTDVMRIGVNSATYLYDYVIATPDPVIGHIDVSFTPPAAGGTIEKEISSYTAAPNCEVTEVQWIPMDGGDWDTFTGGKKYRCTITIVPNEGFFFSSSVPQTTAKFNGIDADVMRIGVNSATYLYDYVIATPDTTPPTGEVKVGTHGWNNFWNTVTFGLLCKNTQSVTITGEDNSGGDVTVQYYLSSTELTAAEAAGISDWQSYTGSIAINPNNKYIVYAKLTDPSGNSTLVNSAGIVVYTDSVGITASLNHVKGSGAKIAEVTLNGNTIAKIMNGTSTLTSGTDYTVSGGTITLTAAYMDGLSAGNYTLTVHYNPMGVAYPDSPLSGSEAPATTSFALTVSDTPITTYTVTVSGGTGGGEYAAGAAVNITANAAPAGQEFDKWTTADGVTFANANNESTSFTMPGKAVTVTATYKDLPVTKYTATVSNGTGGGEYAAGATVNITANTAPSGKEFDKWTTADGVTFANANAASTSFTMPGKAVTVTATYKNLPADSFSITVQNDGNGTANANVTSAVVGAEITLTATAKVGYKFKEWQVVSGGVTVSGNIFTMPAGDVTVKAIFEKITGEAPVYNITDGADSSWEKGTETGVSITGDGDFDNFTGVKIDGVLLSADNYTAVSGSTVVTLKAAYLETLSVGEHTVELVYGDGSASTKLTVLAKDAATDPGETSKPDGSPNTGDSSNFLLLYALLLLSGAGLLGTALYGKKRRTAK